MTLVEQGRNTMTVTVKRRFAASPERVFDARLDPERARRFLFTHPGTQEIVRAEIDARVGGRFLFVTRRNGKDRDQFGEYLEIDRPHRLVFTLCAPAAWSGTSRVQIDIVPAETGCELTLTHDKVLSYEPEEMISFQWNAPPQYPGVRNGGTWVVVQMRPVGADETHVTVTHLGWKNGREWDEAYAHFVRGWGDLMKRLERRFNEGPIDWGKERMLYQQINSAHTGVR